MSNEVAESSADQDLGSGGEMLLPDLTDSSNTVRHLVVGAGKDGNIYVVDRDSMGKFNAGSNNNYQQLSGALPGGIWSTPAYFNGTVYYGDVSGTLKAFAAGKCQARGHAAVADRDPVHASRHRAQRVRERHRQRHRLGPREHQPGGAARLRCDQSGARDLQQQPSGRQIAITSAPATNSSRRWWPTARSSSAPAIASRFSACCPERVALRLGNYGITEVSSAIICSRRCRSGISGVSLTMRTWQMTGERSGKLRDGSGRTTSAFTRTSCGNPCVSMPK